MADKGNPPAAPLARTLLQQCLQATLQVKPADDESEAEYVQVSCPFSVQETCYCSSCVTSAIICQFYICILKSDPLGPQN